MIEFLRNFFGFKKEEPPIVGRRYQFERDKSNPWEQSGVIVEVLEVKEGWVRYSFIYQDKPLDSKESKKIADFNLIFIPL